MTVVRSTSGPETRDPSDFSARLEIPAIGDSTRVHSRFSRASRKRAWAACRSAALMALADVYDAIISRRVYKDPMPHENAVEIIREESGQQFDPVVVQAFLTLADRFREISETFRDEWP